MRVRRSARLYLAAACAGAGTVLVGGCVGLYSELYDEGVVYHLPRTLLTITVTQYTDKGAGRTWYQIGGGLIAKADDPAKSVIDAKIKDESIPDPGHRYVAKYRPNAMSDDRLCVSRSTTGLLRDVSFAADDRTSEIVFNIARFIAGSIGGEKETGLLQDDDTTNKLVVRSYTGQVDPLSKDDADVYAFSDALRNVFGEDLEISTERLKELFHKYTAKLPAGCNFGDRCDPEVWTDRCTRDNICYRTKITAPIDLIHNNTRVDVGYADVINPWDIGAISVTRAFLVHKISKFRFENGVLVGAVIRKPSEIEELSLLPLHVIYAALATPSAALSTAFSSDSGEKIALAKELNELNSAVSQNTTIVQNLQTGAGGPAGTDQNAIYNLDCHAPSSDGSGSIVNIVSGVQY